MVDIPNAYLESWLNGVRKMQKDDIDTASEIGVILSNEEYRQLVSDQLTQKQIRMHSNKNAVVTKALEKLGTETGEQDKSSSSIEDDWLNYFEEYAEKASSGKMQDLWARVLAGEIRKPRAYSLSTMRFLSELDAKTAELFQRRMKNRLPSGYLPRPNELKGKELQELMFLEEMGLLQDAAGNINLNLTPNENGVAMFRNGDLLLICETKNPIRLSLIPITRVGKELLTILPDNDAVAALEYAATEIIEKVDSAKIAHIVEEFPSDQVRYRDLKILKSKTKE